MHHFITEPEIKGDILFIDELRCTHQIYRVLRMKEGQQIVVQWTNGGESSRWTCELVSLGKTQIKCKIIDCQINVKKMLNTFYIAMPNKSSKADLMAQKLAEIGVSKIVFWPAQRSVLKELSDNKLDRMNTIALEAVEQSHGWFIPEIIFSKNIELDDGCVIFEKDDSNNSLICHRDIIIDPKIKSGVVGPEGGFTPEELELFKSQGVQFVDLGDTVLRMETAAIVGARFIQNIGS